MLPTLLVNWTVNHWQRLITTCSDLDWLQGQLNELRESEQKQEEDVAAALASVAALGAQQQGQKQGRAGGLPWSSGEAYAGEASSIKSNVESVWRSVGRPATQPVRTSWSECCGRINFTKVPRGCVQTVVPDGFAA